MTLSKIVSFTAALSLVVALSSAASAGQLKNRTDSPPPSGPSKLVGKQHTVRDLYCQNGSQHHQPCDATFVAYCALIGGVLSPKQPWGGQTCFHQHEW